MKTIKSLREKLEKAQIAQLKKIEKEWDGKLNSFDEAKELLAKFEGIEIYLPWMKSVFQDTYGEVMKKKEWEGYVLTGISELSEYYIKQGFDNYYLITDDCLNEDFDRYSTICLTDMIRENLIDGEPESETEMITVLTSRRGTVCNTIEISALQYITDIIKWCLKNKCTGYTFDW